jgi:hypothetical protein
MKAYTILKDLKTALDPTKPFRYDELPEIDLNDITYNLPN